MLGCIQPMSSPMMNMMFGFFSSAALAGPTNATTAVRARTAQTVLSPVVKGDTKNEVLSSCIFDFLIAVEKWPRAFRSGLFLLGARSPICESLGELIGPRLERVVDVDPGV